MFPLRCFSKRRCLKVDEAADQSIRVQAYRVAEDLGFVDWVDDFADLTRFRVARRPGSPQAIASPVGEKAIAKTLSTTAIE